MAIRDAGDSGRFAEVGAFGKTSADRFSACLTASVLLHMLILSVHLPNKEGHAASVMPFVPAKTIQLNLRAPQKQAPLIEAKPLTEKPPPVKSIAPETPKPSAVPSEEPSEESSPVIASEISSYVDFLFTPGFMILSITVDERGKVEATEVIYTELPAIATHKFEQRFAEAQYSPALRNGLPVKGTLLLKIDATQ